jgi:hypothetical protein
MPLDAGQSLLANPCVRSAGDIARFEVASLAERGPCRIGATISFFLTGDLIGLHKTDGRVLVRPLPWRRCTACTNRLTDIVWGAR